MIYKRVIGTVLFLFSAILLFSQQTYRIEPKNADGLYQISWPAVRNAVRYVLILQKDGGEQVEVITSIPQAELTLEPGSYRFNVTAYHPRPDTVLPWDSFTVAVRPRISSFSPRGIRSGEIQLTLDIKGKNILPDSKVTLVFSDGTPINSISFTADPSGEKAQASFEIRDLPAGSYMVNISNPDGMGDSLGNFVVSSPKFQIYVGYAPVFPLHGSWFKTFDDIIYPLGAEIRGGYFFLETAIGDLGAEAVVAWDYMNTTWNYSNPVPTNVKISANLFELRANAMLQKMINQSSAVVFRAGFGMAVVMGIDFKFPSVSSGSSNYFYPITAFGASYVRDLNDSFYIEAGLDYTLVLSKKVSGYIRPFAGAGWRF